MTADQVMPVGIVIERRESHHPWLDATWQPVAVIPHAPAIEAPRPLVDGDGWSQVHAATLPIQLFKGETEGYVLNLSQAEKVVYVVLRADEEADSGLSPFLATVCPFEASAYTESGEEIVRGVPMPAEIVHWLAAFVAEHHVEEPFRKRKNKKHRVEKEWTRPRGRFGPSMAEPAEPDVRKDRRK